ncbi:putative phiE125 gp8 family phage protein [Lutibacter sp. Hel_I_33_5]|uniref:head-tail connector protein n=1 Tax=Lutibacter sp. Hel_I_33_5 TaxID=1566289 RepID=UPI00119F9D8E|nr:head-tail connector protein [Lutibacter sp. Hel_I_33_5]TVZ55603.1 putative phiE125 gp8 family phage protein [Lutibacter sp. Hel_I_33_5]
MARIIDVAHTPTELITKAKAKKQLNIETSFTEDDDLIQDCIDAAIAYAERATNTIITEAKYQITGVDFADVLSFGYQKIKSLDEFTYKDEEGNVQTLSADSYSLNTVDDFENRICYTEGVTLPKVKAFTPDAVSFKVTCGYTKKPKDLIKAIMLLITDFYEVRGTTVKEKNTTADVIFQSYRYYKVDEK